MTRSESTEGGDLPLSVRAEAAAWLATLGGPRRTRELEERFGRWLVRCEPHRIAWERVSDAWDLAGGLTSKIDISGGGQRDVSPRKRSLLPGILALAAAALLAVAATLVLLLARASTISTGVGERRVLSLLDGSRVTLNTDTRIVVGYTARARRVQLERGEALFEVKRAPRWPFIVTAGGREIRALGTAFEVRRYGSEQVSITLVEGRIVVAPAGKVGSRRAPDLTVLTSAGERLTFAPNRAPRLDRPVLNQVIAWQNGEVVFDSTPLSDAAREMNRYSDQQIVLGDPRVASLRISGLFQAGDTAEFAQGVAATFGLRVQKSGDRIILLGPSGPPSRSR